MTDDDARAQIQASVSRETFDRLELYATLLVKWQKAINLVSPSTLNQLWARHFLDSAQVLAEAPEGEGTWCDLGSGGGFPGLVCATIAKETRPGYDFHLVEADLRKSSFLRETARQMGVKVGVFSRRIEDLPPQNAQVISARALSSLDTLCGYAHRHLAPGGVALFQKGARHAEEVAKARRDWHMEVTAIPSQTADDAVILRIEQLQNA